MIDITDLRPAKLSEIIPGIIFYKKIDDGFETCRIEPEEIKNPVRADELRFYTKLYAEQGILYLRINRPGKGFSE